MDTNVLIIGGGLVGQSLALAISPYVSSVTILDRVDLKVMLEDDFDSRAMALAYNALCILKGLDVWDELSQYCQPIHQVHVSNKGALGRVMLDHKKENKPCLGAICPFTRIYSALYQKLLIKDNIHLISPANIESFDTKKNKLHLEHKNRGMMNISAKLIIACDGAKSAIRNQLGIDVSHTDYDAYALVCNIKLKRSHKNIAFERFYDDGIIAMLPLKNNQSACVFTFSSQRKDKINQMSDENLKDYLQALFGYRLGQFIQISKRAIFPLHLIVAKKMYSDNTLLFGNAMHLLHPVAGQGFNLCLRDVAVLADLISCYGVGNNNHQLLEQFEKLRIKDHKQTIWASNQLASLFSNNNRLVKASRGLGLHLTERLPIGKTFINRMMMGDMIQLPKLARERVNQWEI